MVIWKYTLAITDRQQVSMPKGAGILAVANQRGALFLWAMVDPSSLVETEDHDIEIIGTGNQMPDTEDIRRYIGSAVLGPFVWHVFERVGR